MVNHHLLYQIDFEHLQKDFFFVVVVVVVAVVVVVTVVVIVVGIR